MPASRCESETLREGETLGESETLRESETLCESETSCVHCASTLTVRWTQTCPFQAIATLGTMTRPCESRKETAPFFL